jgi:peptide/nickel transport system ATP-binding protein
MMTPGATATEDSAPALELRDIRVELKGGAAIVDGVNLTIRRGEIVGLVGESGSGKTTTALSIFGLAGNGLRLANGEVALAGIPLRDEAAFRSARGRSVSYVPQNPGTALNPSLRVGSAIDDVLNAGNADLARRAHLLDSVGLPSDRAFARRYPHQLSGGQQQRVCIAEAIASNPGLIVLDEPTTGLDVVTQAKILRELSRLRDKAHVAMLYITHDLAVAAQIADTIAVMYAGKLVEYGPTSTVLRTPRHPYTRGLIAATPDHVRWRTLEVMKGIVAGVEERPAGCAFAPRCPQAVATCLSEPPALVETAPGHAVRCPEWQRTPTIDWSAARLDTSRSEETRSDQVVIEVRNLRAEHPGRRGALAVARDISFKLKRSACLALVGESGSGKTTIARVIAGLHPIAAGEVLLNGEALPGRAARRTVEQRRQIQIIFQNPAEALNPQATVGEAIARPAQLLRGLTRTAARAEVSKLLEAVRLPAAFANRYPRELSGGECQRVAIARALAANPSVIVCDEITAALDVSVQATVLDLLRDLQKGSGLSMIFITHDLGVVASVADEVLVLDHGAICEQGDASRVLTDPQHPYTRGLLAAAPSLGESIGDWTSATPAA